MYLAINRCNDIAFYITAIDNDVHILGLDNDVIAECFVNDINKLNRDILFIPRKIITVDEKRLEKCFEYDKSILMGCIPMNINVARRIAKIQRLSTIIITPSSLRFVNENQVNFMHQSSNRNKYIEVHLQPFLKMFLISGSIHSIEKSFYLLGNIIERALKLDVGIIISTASDDDKKLCSLTHVDIILFYLGFSKRERRLITEVYPTELLITWLNYK
jgi:hypothetical protein